MANFVYNTAAKEIFDQSLDLLVDTIKVGLSTSTHTADRDDDTLDDGTASDFSSGELSGTGYTAGFNGAGRKTLASKAIVVDKTNDRAEFDAADLTWTGLAGAAGTIANIELFKEITNDASSRAIAHIDTGTGLPLIPNGGDVTVAWNAEGIIQLRTT